MRPLFLALCLTGLSAPAFAQSDLLATYDTNGDGALSLTEFQATQRDMFRHADANGDGVLTAAELKPLVPNPSRVLRRDGNGDGALSVEEFQSEAAGFRRADRNRDGVLGPKELSRLQTLFARARG